MQTRPRHAVHALFALLFAAAVLVAGCSSSTSESSKALPDAATLLKESSETTRNLQSVHLQLTVAGQIPELPLESLAGDLTNTPAVAAQGKANILFLGQRLEGVDFVVADGILYGAISAGSYQDFGPAAGRKHQLHQQLQRGRLSSAVGAQKAEHFTGLDAERQAIERPIRALSPEADRVVFCQLVCGKRGHVTSRRFSARTRSLDRRTAAPRNLRS